MKSSTQLFSPRCSGCIVSTRCNVSTTTRNKEGTKKNKEGDEDEEWVFHLVSYKLFRKTRNIPEFVVDYKEVGEFWLWENIFI